MACDRVATGLALVLGGVLAVSATAHAEGSISGTVRIEGAASALRPLVVVKDGPVCGKQIPNDALVLGAGGALANVVVSIRGARAKAAPPPTAKAFVDQVGCRYTPHVQAVTVGTKLTLLNNDAVFHNVHANLLEGSRGVTVFNLAMPFKGQRLPALIKRPGVMKIRCDAGHTWMSAYVLAFDHPHFAVTGASGRFTLEDVPAGQHTLELWHEPLDGQGSGKTQTIVVKVEDGKRAELDATMKL